MQNFMTEKEKFEFYTWVKENEIKLAGRTYQEIIGIAEKELSFRPTLYHVGKAFNMFKIPKSRSPRGRGVAELVAKTQKQNAQIRTLALALREL